MELTTVQRWHKYLARASRACAEQRRAAQIDQPIVETNCSALVWMERVLPLSEQAAVVDAVVACEGAKIDVIDHATLLGSIGAPGYGSGDGSGYGYGSGDGDGSGYGYGSGDGYGDGYGSGDGYGYGYGYGSGDGYGYGD